MAGGKKTALALLGGLGAAAMLAGRKKDDDYEAQDKQEGYESTAVKKVAPKIAPKPAKVASASDEGVTASGLPREARGIKAPTRDEGVTASGLPREARGVMDTRTTGQKFADRQARAADVVNRARREQLGFKKGGTVGSASKRADGCATKGKTRGKMV